jgi:hypothetical protein
MICKHQLYRRFPFLPFIFLLFAGLLAGCASQATHQGMIPDAIDISSKNPETVSVEVSGGQETGSIGKPQISDAEFKHALMESLNKSQIFSSVAEGKNGNYFLSVILFPLEQPAMGFSMTVKMEVGWTLVRASDGAKVWQESIKSEYTAGVGDAFAAVKRLRLATEGAAKRNISQALAKLSRVNVHSG